MFAEDMSVFFSQAGFAVAATFVPAAGGAAVSASVIFDVQTEDLLGGNSLSDEFAIQYPAAELPGVLAGDFGEVDGVRYKIREIRLQDDGKVKRARLTRV